MEELRIDKYLWAIRVFKTRSEATDACKGGKIRINGADTKPSKPVRVGDVIVARKGAVTYTYKVLWTKDKGPDWFRYMLKIRPRRRNSTSFVHRWRPSSLSATGEPDVLPRKTEGRWRACGIT